MTASSSGGGFGGVPQRTPAGALQIIAQCLDNISYSLYLLRLDRVSEFNLDKRGIKSPGLQTGCHCHHPECRRKIQRSLGMKVVVSWESVVVLPPPLALGYF